MKFAALYCVYDDHEYLDESIIPIADQLDKVLFLIDHKPWNGEKFDNSKTITKIQGLCSRFHHFQFIHGHWETEKDARNFGIKRLELDGIDFTFIIDSDELYFEQHFLNLKQFIKQNSHYSAFHGHMFTYWTKEYYRIAPPENYKPLLAIKNKEFIFTYARQGDTLLLQSGDTIIKSNKYNGIIVPFQIAIMYHLSYARTNEFVKKKIAMFTHKPELIENWYENIWLKWKPNSNDFHPVTPQQYHSAIKEDLTNFPPLLRSFIKREKMNKRICSIIILNWNSLDLLKRCLLLIEKNTHRPYEIIIIDNGSKDDSAKYIESLKVKKILNKENKGFPIGVNQGILIAENNDICLLNVDAEVQDEWLENLYETMMNNPDCGLVGPLGNAIPSRHQEKGQVDIDTKTSNIHGFCFLILREVIEKIGLFDQRYGLGNFEDTDYCVRAKLAGYYSYISAKSLVIHKPHQVCQLNNVDSSSLELQNRELYLNKFFAVMFEHAKINNFFENKEIAIREGLIIQKQIF